MKIQLEKVKTLKDDKDYLQRQQDIDAILVLSKLLEPGMVVNQTITEKVGNKISNLIEKV